MNEKKCPYCAEMIKIEAIRCKHCQADLTVPMGTAITDSSQKPSENAQSPISSVHHQSPPAVKEKGMGLSAKICIAAVVSVVAFLGFGAVIGNTPEAKGQTLERNGIKYCWQEQSKKSLDPAAQRLAATACEMMEEKYRATYGRNP